jgi:propionyl-CoA synthetase
VEVLDEEGNSVPPGTMGEIVIKEPLPPGCLTTLFENAKLCQETYFAKYSGYYKTGDAGYLDKDDYVWVMARTDDVINGL